ncbi:unnamed protein product [Trichogramma brassicae]|uniref:Uncharacterized protein n=1 Tax=Trichogramma brassicae TaxID=86971 RepID=A0A6H5IUB7_9HYME|nr:unnamed protein product [Trichogramma brassicae]
MNYLRTYVKGEAAELLQEVSVWRRTLPYGLACSVSHYDNRRLLVNKLMTKLMALPPMANESAAELMRVLNGVRNLLQALKALGSPVDHWDHLTVFLTRSKITQKCQSKWEDNVKQAGGPTVPDTFENFIVKRVYSFLLCCTIDSGGKAQKWLSLTVQPWISDEADYAQDTPEEDSSLECTSSRESQKRAKRQQEADERRRRHYVDQVEDIFAEGKPITDEDYENLETKFFKAPLHDTAMQTVVLAFSVIRSLARIDRLVSSARCESRARVTLRTRRTRRLDGSITA